MSIRFIAIHSVSQVLFAKLCSIFPQWQMLTQYRIANMQSFEWNPIRSIIMLTNVQYSVLLYGEDFGKIELQFLLNIDWRRHCPRFIVSPLATCAKKRWQHSNKIFGNVSGPSCVWALCLRTISQPPIVAAFFSHLSSSLLDASHTAFSLWEEKESIYRNGVVRTHFSEAKADILYVCVVVSNVTHQ